ncbi:MAG: family 16 glycosylhydrolase [Chitinispirillia bacterium]|nr:family 16 glycosylhydrolase [Chitinispirillia bacterium]
MRGCFVVLALLAAVSQGFAQALAGDFSEDFNSSQAPGRFNFGTGGVNNSTWANGVESEIEPGTRVMRLAAHPDNAADPWQGPNFTSKSLTRFGRYSARIKIPGAESQPLVGAVVGFFTYYNDQYNDELQKDENGNGLSDNSEIDFEWLIANPQLVYLTAWTDHAENGTCKKIARIVNLATGQILTTNYSERVGGASTALTGVENQPTSIRTIPGFDASKKFYTYGFDWQSDNIRWWILNPEDALDTMVLWYYRGNAAVGNSRITQKPAFLMFNIWHTNDWSAEGKPKSTEKPKSIFYADFDWMRYEAVIPKDSATSAIRNTAAPLNADKNIRASIINRQINIALPAGASAANIALYDVRGRLLFRKDISAKTISAKIALPGSITKNQMIVLQINTNGHNFTKRALVK